MENKFKYLLQLFLLLIIILLVTFLLIPIAQKSVNSHTGGNDFFSIVFNIIGLFFIAKLIYQIFKKKNFIVIIITLLYAITFIILGLKFYNLVCFGCSQG